MYIKLKITSEKFINYKAEPLKKYMQIQKYI